MQISKKRTKDIFVDKAKVKAIKKRESKMVYENRKQKVKDFFGIGKPKKKKIPPIKAKASKMRIFDDDSFPKKTPDFYNMERGGKEPPKPKDIHFKKKPHPLDDIPEKKRIDPPIQNQILNNEPEEVGFLERIKNYFKPAPLEPMRQPQNKIYDDDNPDMYMSRINKKKLNFDYSRSYNDEIPSNVNK